MYDFDRDTDLVAEGEGCWKASLSPGWCVGAVPNGGYLKALSVAALGRVLPHPDPFTVTTHYLRPCAAGPAEIVTEVLRVGRGHSTARATLSQGGKARLVTMGTWGDLGAVAGPDFRSAAPPVLPPPEACEGIEGAQRWIPEVARRFEFRYPPRHGRWFAAGDEIAELGGWIRFSDGRPPDVASLAMFCDAFPPPIRAVMEIGWVPTLELTLHVKGRPSPGWLRCWFKTRWCQGGYLEEDGEIWDSEGKLVALSRQMAQVTFIGP